MNNGAMINKIKSKYILKYLFNYIGNTSFELKIFIHSKYFQNKLNLTQSYYYKKFLDSLGFNLNKYIYKEEDDLALTIDSLTRDYDLFITKNNLNKEKVESVLYEILNGQNAKNKRKYYINIESPLFEMISKTNDFEKKYIIYISQKIIDGNTSNNVCLSKFDKLNKENIKYSSILYAFNDIAKIEYLKSLNINYNNIRRLDLRYNGNNIIISDEIIKNKIDILNLFKNLEQLFLKGITFDLLINAEFKELKELNLSNNYISNIKQLEKVKFDALEKLFLNDNEISNIKELSICNFGKLKVLNLSNNYILNIGVLEIVKFDNLEKLYLNHNKIRDIKALEKCSFKKLKELYLNYNKITGINTLENWNFKNLKILNISHNQISDINILEKCNFNELEKLDLSYNDISDINVLSKVKFEKLEKLYLNHNQIKFINVLENCNFNQLEKLDLSFNKITNLEVLERIKFHRLEKLYLSKKESTSTYNYFRDDDLNEAKEFIISFNKLFTKESEK